MTNINVPFNVAAHFIRSSSVCPYARFIICSNPNHPLTHCSRLKLQVGSDPLTLIRRYTDRVTLKSW